MGIPSIVKRYGTPVGLVGIVLALNRFLFSHGVEGVEFPLFLMAIAITVWYGGVGPAIVAVVLSAFTFNYYFTRPYYSLYVTRADLPYYAVFIIFALLISWFAIVRRKAEHKLLESREELRREVAVRTQQASLLDLTHDCIFVRDLEGVIKYWNRGAEELYGWTAEQAVGRRTQELLKTVYPVSFDEVQRELIDKGRWEGELKKTTAKGASVVVVSRWSLQRDEQHNPAAILESENDVTERRQQEEDIRGLNEQLTRRSADLEVTNKELEAFAYSVSHDLRAPLRHMVGYAELVQKNPSLNLDETGRRHMQNILEAAKRMGNLIDDLLAFSRIGRAETRETMVSLEQLVKEVRTEIGQDVRSRGMTWKVGPLPDVYGDRAMLKLAFVNLISNAVKFTRTRSQPEVEIGFTDQPANGVVVFVKDNGVGFNMKYANKLFGVFQRLHRADEFEGTGIGLATVQRIIHRHGGRIWAEAQLGAGATFYFSLPKP
jgi:PAS domain S-box-containing protein